MDNEFHVANTSNMGIGLFNFPSPIFFPPREEGGGEGDLKWQKCCSTLSDEK
jgi:hypothetical protein